MAYSELIKNFSRIRAYLRSFYVHGFRHRDEYTAKSARSYDNERRRIESWLGDYMSFGQDDGGRRVFLSVDSRAIPENPLYRAFRTKSFTDRDIMLHFHLLDILNHRNFTEGGEVLSITRGLSITEIMDRLSDRLADFEEDAMPDESTVRKKLREYSDLGLINVEKRGREKIYVLSRDSINLDSWDAAAAFFSETAPLGVIGSFLQDRMKEKFRKFRFKHHYILNALDSEILFTLFSVIRESRQVTLTLSRQKVTVLPLRIYIGTQTGRQYLLACSAGAFTEKSGKKIRQSSQQGSLSEIQNKTGPQLRPESQVNIRFAFYRTDLIDSIKTGEKTQVPDSLPRQLEDFCSHVWGVAGSNSLPLQHIEMTVFAGPDEGHIAQRLEREKRCGTVEKLNDSHWRFSADIYDALEILPWLRTFTGRITDLQCTDRRVTDRFRKDFASLAAMYGVNGLEGDENDAIS